MLIHPTREKLQALKLTGGLRALDEQNSHPEMQTLSFEERLGLLVDRELLVDRDNRRLKTRLRAARLRQSASLEDIDYRHPRGLDRALLTALGTRRWVREHLNILLCGPTGVGKTWLACALAHQSCREGYRTLYHRLPRLLQDLTLARADGRYGKMLRELAKTDVLVLDDWGLAKLTDEHRRDLLEILDDRHGRGSSILTSQFPVDRWHELVGDPTLADAILNRLVHNAYRLNLTGDSMRKKQVLLTSTDDTQ